MQFGNSSWGGEAIPLRLWNYGWSVYMDSGPRTQQGKEEETFELNDFTLADENSIGVGSEGQVGWEVQCLCHLGRH